MTNEELVEAFMRGDSYSEMSKSFGVTISVVASRLYWLRSIGVNLPKRNNRIHTDIEALNGLIERAERKGR